MRKHAIIRRIGHYLRYLAIGVALVTFLFPVYWVILTSFKPPAQIMSSSPVFFFRPTVETYVRLLTSDFPRSFFASLIVSLSSVFLSLLLGTPAAYGLARFRFRGRENLEFWILSVRMAPPFGFVVAYYLIMRNLHLLDTHWALIITYVVFNLPLIIWLLISFFQDVPKDIEEAALIDGCTEWGAFLRVVLPAVAPGIAAAAVLGFVYSWQEFLYAFVLAGSRTRTIPVTIASGIGFYGIEWDKMCAISTLSMIPMFLFALLAQKYLVRGLTLGAVKG